MGRFISLLMSGYTAGTISTEQLNDTGRVQETYIVENYFRRTEEMNPKYGFGRVLGQRAKTNDGKRVKYTNRTDCAGMIFGYMIELGLCESKRDCIISGGGNASVAGSKALYSMGEPKKKEEIKRGDLVYRERADGTRHIAIACEDGKTTSYDLKGVLSCRDNYGYVSKLQVATNPITGMIDGVLPEVEEVMAMLRIAQFLKNNRSLLSMLL